MQMTTERNGSESEVGTLYMAIELSDKSWLVGSALGPGQRSRRVTLSGGDWRGLLTEVSRARAQFGVSESAGVVCCFEAGRDGFWLARCLIAHGVVCWVVDAGSIRRRPGKRHHKTDRLDVETMLRDLMRYASGDRSVFRTVRVPSESSEDLRQLQRERRGLVRERTAHWNRIRGLLVSRGVRVARVSKLQREDLVSLRLWNGQPLGEELVHQLSRELRRTALVEEQIAELTHRRRELLRERPESHQATLECVERLLALRAVGDETAWTCATELFGWRDFQNRRQVGGYLGLCGTPHQSGESEKDLGIGKDGPGWVRALSIELAWGWLRFQPDSALSQWYQERYGTGKRNRRRGIVALARRLMVALWKYLEQGALPQGATLKTEAA